MSVTTVNKCVFGLAAAILAAHCALAAPAPDSVALTLERELTAPSLELIESGLLEKAPPPVTQAPAPRPVAATGQSSRWPALLLAAFFVALAAFAAGIMAGRRPQITARNAAVELWRTDSETATELERARTELADEQERNQELVAELGRLTAQQRADAAAATVQALQLGDDGSGGELDQAHATIDELRAEIEVLRGAEADLERAKRDEPGDGSVEALHEELDRRQQHIRELEEVMSAVRTERDAMTERLQELEQGQAEVTDLLAERERALQQAQAALDEVRQSAPSAERVAELEARLAAASEAADEAQDLRRQLAELSDEAAEAQDLRRQLAELSEEAAEAQSLRQRLGELEQENGAQQRELLALGEAVQVAEREARRISALEHELASRCEEVETLRAEAVALGATPAGLEEEFAAAQSYVRELEDRNEHLQAHIHELEQALRRDEDKTTQLELGSAQADVRPGANGALALAAALDKSERRVLELQGELDEAREEIGLINRDPTAADLQRENIRLSALAVQREHAIAELQAKLDDIESKEERLGEWTTTVSSLESELRRKTSLLDARTDELQADEQRVAELGTQLRELNTRLAVTEEENETLRELLGKSKAAAAALRVQVHHSDDDTIRMRLERDSDDEPAAPVGRDAGPQAADIDTLRFTVESRRDLAVSLEAILAGEREALELANQRLASREQLTLELENEIAANRVTIAAMQNRLGRAREQRHDPAAGTTNERLESELQRSVRASEKLRVDLLTWRRRVKPLHDAVVLRDGRIKVLESELAALRQTRIATLARPGPATVEAPGEGDAEERIECLEQIESLRVGIERTEQSLAEVGTLLSRALAAEEAALQELEHLEAARAGQLIRMDELHHELEIYVGADAGEVAKVVDFRAHNPV